jgi:hypothetical protein
MTDRRETTPSCWTRVESYTSASPVKQDHAQQLVRRNSQEAFERAAGRELLGDCC